MDENEVLAEKRDWFLDLSQEAKWWAMTGVLCCLGAAVVAVRCLVS